MAKYRGVYINLDRSPGRRAAMEAQFGKLGLSAIYARLPAVDGNLLRQTARAAISPREEGAFRSHANALRQMSGGDAPAHILEDDAILTARTRAVIDQAIDAGLLDRFDILFTDTFVAPDLGMLKALNHAFGTAMAAAAGNEISLGALQVLDVTRRNFACLTSYVVSPRALPRLLALVTAELDAGPGLPIDLFLRQCAQTGKLTAGLLAPFVTSFDLGEVRRSTIGAGTEAAKPSVMVMAVLRYLFFIERDLAAASATLNAIFASTAPSTEQSRLIATALEFILSEEFRQF